MRTCIKPVYRGFIFILISIFARAKHMGGVSVNENIPVESGIFQLPLLIYYAGSYPGQSGGVNGFCDFDRNRYPTGRKEAYGKKPLSPGFYILKAVGLAMVRGIGRQVNYSQFTPGIVS